MRSRKTFNSEKLSFNLRKIPKNSRSYIFTVSLYSSFFSTFYYFVYYFPLFFSRFTEALECVKRLHDRSMGRVGYEELLRQRSSLPTRTEFSNCFIIYLYLQTFPLKKPFVFSRILHKQHKLVSRHNVVKVFSIYGQITS